MSFPDERRGLRRRDLLCGGAATLLLGSCAPRRKSADRPRVSIIKAASYSGELAGTIRRALREHGVQVSGKRVLLKPNLVEFDPGAAINTHPAVVYAALEAFRSLGAAQVRIAEGPGHRRNTWELAEAAGYFEAVPGFESQFTDLNLDDVRRISLPHANSTLREIYAPQTALEADLIVSMPKMKTHHWVGATLSMKNFFGLVPGGVYGWPKNVLHWAGIPECIADLHAAFPKHFAIVDGIVGMEGNGPIQGTPKTAGVLVVGSDMVAVDATCCRIMGIDPAGVRYLRLAERRDQTAAPGVQQIGEPIAAVVTPFRLLPQFRALRLSGDLSAKEKVDDPRSRS
ncbi:MAG TPA: DUF362 domain-containing protein [Bryobacteraceae bacterium]|nr:DUF362 domain-containing protein [Bryobacteraceae bacterium]